MTFEPGALITMVAPDLTTAELAASVRFVAREAPHLALALVWSIVTNPEAVDALRDAGPMVEPEHLAELTELDDALRIAVEASGPARQRRSAAAADSASLVAPQGSLSDLDAMRDRVVRGVRYVATERPELLPALLARIYRRASSRLAIRAHRLRGQETLALAALDVGVEVDVDDLFTDEPKEDRPT